MRNSDIADVLSLYGKLMDIHQENEFKVKSYANASFQIDRLEQELSTMTKDQICATWGIGKSIGQQVIELLETGEMEAFNNLIQKTPAGILELLNIKGIGPKKIGVIWRELQIESPGELLYACNENRLVNYKGFGVKTQEKIQEAIEFYFNNQSRFLWAQIRPVADVLEQQLRNLFQGCPLALTGSLVRQCDIIDQVEFVLGADLEMVMEAISHEPGFVVEREEAGTVYALFENHVHVEITCCEVENFSETYFFTLNSPKFNDAFQEQFPDVMYQGETADDTSFFEEAGIPYILPCLRDQETIIDDARQGNLPTLIELSDIKGVIHNHSTWSDGKAGIEDMAKECIRLGYEYLVMSDHSVTSFYARGLTEEQIDRQHEEIDRLNETLKPFKIFKSIECDILGEGQLDYNDRVLSSFDLVIASVHQNLHMTEEKAMKRILTAVENPHTTILGHPSGRLLLSRKEYPLNYTKLIETCAQHKVVIEINANPRRLDLDWRYIKEALQHQVKLSINPDAHSLLGIQDIRYGVLSAQKAGLSKGDNLSSLSLHEFESYLAALKS